MIILESVYFIISGKIHKKTKLKIQPRLLALLNRVKKPILQQIVKKTCLRSIEKYISNFGSTNFEKNNF